MSQLTHINAAGEAHMVDVSAKAETVREARAEAFVTMLPDTLAMIIDGSHHKGDVFATARIAGIQAAKRTWDLIPLCHPLMLSKVEVNLQAQPEHNRVRIESLCRLTGKTGVEMEALTAASVAALTIYDMCKAVQKDMVIGPVRLLAKSGGKSGDFKVDSHDLLFFAQVRELVNTDSLTLEATFKDVAALRAHLAAQSDRWALALDEGKLLAAVNQTLVEFTHPLAAGDEVAFFPPVTGG